MFDRSGLKKTYFVLRRLTGGDGRLLRAIRERGLVPVLNLHQVSPHTNPFWPPLDPRVFEDLLVFLKRHFNVVRLGDLDSAETDGKPRAVLSFDDGYHSFVEYAMPLLERHGLAANMNVIPACAESGEPPWNVRLYDFLNSVPRRLVNEMQLPGFDRRLEDDSAAAKVRYGLSISRFLKMRPRAERERLWPHVERAMEKAPSFETTRMMSAAEIREAARTHEIGVHSFSHESMEYEDDQFFLEDLRRCREYFASALGLPLDIYAFPNGSYRAEQVGLLRREGFARVLLVGERFARAGSHVYPRFTIYGESAAEVRFQALGYNGRKSPGGPVESQN